MKVVVAGSSGFIGTALVASLNEAGHEVLCLVRRPATAQGEVAWDPATGTLDAGKLHGVEAAVNLAGAGVADHRWTKPYKQEIIASRVNTTRTLAAALTTLDPLPKVLVAGSAVGFYGDRGNEELTEDSPRGTGFLAEVTMAWEAASETASEAGIRVVHARSGIVLGPSGGALQKMLRLARLGLSGRLGTGRQWWAWITLVDEVDALVHLLTADVVGPVNLCAPNPARQAEVARAIGKAVGRSFQLPAPALGLHLALGGFAEDVLGSARARPTRLVESGYEFRYGELAQAVEWMTG